MILFLQFLLWNIFCCCFRFCCCWKYESDLFVSFNFSSAKRKKKLKLKIVFRGDATIDRNNTTITRNEMIITRLSRHIMTIVTVSLMVTMQERRFSQAATICNTSCNTGLIVDMRTCTCVPNISCDDPSLSDPPMCETIECDLSNQSICPKKCLCSMPSPLTNYCEPCYNDGVLDKTTCKCTCPWPYQVKYEYIFIILKEILIRIELISVEFRDFLFSLLSKVTSFK